jgi:transketolase
MNRVISKDDYSGDYIHFGVREHAMAAIMNGITLHQKDFLRPFGGTFLAFSDYMRPAIRLSALMNLPVLYIFTHDSIWLGEDGPTHQPVEHLASLRSIPNLFVMRPCNPLELSLCLSEAIKQSNPTALVLTRQEIEVHDISGDDDKSSDFISGYLYAGSGTPDVTIVATGSEVSIALKVRRHLQDIYKISTNVISIPCMELFLKKDQTSIDDLLKHNKRLVFIEAALSLYSNRIVNSKTMFFGVNQFGGSGHLKELIDVFEFDDKVIADKIARNI